MVHLTLNAPLITYQDWKAFYMSLSSTKPCLSFLSGKTGILNASQSRFEDEIVPDT